MTFFAGQLPQSAAEQLMGRLVGPDDPHLPVLNGHDILEGVDGGFPFVLGLKDLPVDQPLLE
ncbi:MAG: hypothetical protein ACD_75C00662G0002 [uncultured bacterium]|nr:MAG: hypothetical protein ACD_75C00662G0002 [uncultured bacterium]